MLPFAQTIYEGRVLSVSVDTLACLLASPFPLADFRQIVPYRFKVFLVLDEFVTHRLLGIRREIAQLWDSIDDIARETKPVHIIADNHIEGGRRGTFLYPRT